MTDALPVLGMVAVAAYCLRGGWLVARGARPAEHSGWWGLAVALSTEVGPAPNEIFFRNVMLVNEPRTEIYFETEFWPQKGADTEADSVAKKAGFEAALVQADGKETPLELTFVNNWLVGAAPGQNGDWRPAFKSLRLRARMPLRFGKVLWVTCDPSKLKTGRCFEKLVRARS